MEVHGVNSFLSRGRAKLTRVKEGAVHRVELSSRVDELEAEIQECRQLNLRLAELMDVVQELLLPVAQRDEEKLAVILRKYSDQLG